MSESPNQPPRPPTPYEPPRSVDYRVAPQLPDLLAPGRRAATVMFILGGLALACGTLIGTAMSRMSDADLLKSTGMKIQDVSTTGMPYTPIQIMRASAVIGTVGMVLVGVAYLGLGLLVRRGSRVAAVFGIVLSCLAIGWVLLNGVYAFFASGNVPAGICTLGFVGVMVPVLVVLIKWLVQSLPAAGQLAAYRQHLALQQMYFYHQQQLHQQPGPAGSATPESMPDYAVPPPIINPPPQPPGAP